MNRWVLGVSILLTSFAIWQFADGEKELIRPAHDVSMQRPLKAESVEAVPTLVKEDPLELKVILKTHYMDGVTETTTKLEKIWSMMDFWAEYEGWTVADQQLDRVVFQRQLTDISPLTKQQGYFGLTPDGELAVYYGEPEEGKVIESFKPIPIKPLESKRKILLEDGIKIDNVKHFQQVLKQYTKKQGI